MVTQSQRGSPRASGHVACFATGCLRDFSNRPRRSRRQGFVLIVVVALLAFLVLCFTRLASISIRAAGDAVEAERDLQLRWRLLSLQRLAAARASFLIDQAQEDLNAQGSMSLTATSEYTFVSSTSIVLDFRGLRYRVHFGDETAKLPLVRVLRNVPLQVAWPTFQKLSGGAFRSESTIDSNYAPSSWNEVFQFDGGDGFMPVERIQESTGEMTLWGNGRIRLRHAHPSTLDALWRLLFGRPAPREFHEARQKHPRWDAKELIESLGLRETQQETILAWLTDGSEAYSIWLVPEIPSSESPRLYINGRGSSGQTFHRAFLFKSQAG